MADLDSTVVKGKLIITRNVYISTKSNVVRAGKVIKKGKTS